MTSFPTQPSVGLRRRAVSAVAVVCSAIVAACSATGQAPGEQAPGRNAPSQSAVSLSRNDVLFNEHVFRVGSRYWSGMCGFTIHGNYDSRQVPRPEWAISIDELMDGDTPVVRVHAAKFEVVSEARDSPRKPLAPITALAFTLKGEQAPLVAQFAAEGGRTNAMTATLETTAAQRLLEAFYGAQPIKISLTYQDGASEVLNVRNWSDLRQFTGLNGYLHQCLERLNTVPDGVKEIKYTLVSPGRAYGFGFESPNSNTAPWE
jgi:hypothetical protein